MVKAHTIWLVHLVSSHLQIFEASKAQLQLPFYMKIIVTMCWSIWTVKNDVIFKCIPASIQRCKSIFRTEFDLVILRAKVASFQLLIYG